MSRRARVALLVILGLAAGLRFTGLGWGLRHTPHWDERVFVENARAMVEERSLDHRFYEYPGLFFYLLFPILWAIPRGVLESPEAYLVVRGFGAAWSMLSVGLVFLLGRRLISARAGLVAALCLAISPDEIVTTHMVRPDVVLGSFVLLACFAFLRVAAEPRGDVLSGIALGAASAVKFTGLLLLPSYLAARLLAPGPRLGRIALAGVLVVLVTLAFTPYALIHYPGYLGGVDVQMSAHYRGRAAAPSYLGQVAYYLGTIAWAFGPLGAGLVLLGSLSIGREWRLWLPIVLHPVTTIAVMSTAELRFPRHLVPTSGLLALLLARGVEVLAQRWPRTAPVVVGLAALSPLGYSLAYVRGVEQPSNKDHALDWVLAHVPAGARVLTTVDDLGLDTSRYEVLRPSQWEPAGRILSRNVDAAVVADAEAARYEGLMRAALPETRSPHAGDRLAFFSVPDALRPSYRRVPLEAAWLRASDSEAELPNLVDGADSGWQTPSAQRPGEWIELAFPRPLRIARVELMLAGRPLEYAQNLHVYATADGLTWRRLLVVQGRPPVEQQLLQPKSQLLLFDPVAASGLRLLQVGRRRRPWGISELRLDTLP